MISEIFFCLVDHVRNIARGSPFHGPGITCMCMYSSPFVLAAVHTSTDHVPLGRAIKQRHMNTRCTTAVLGSHQPCDIFPTAFLVSKPAGEGNPNGLSRVHSDGPSFCMRGCSLSFLPMSASSPLLA